MIRMKKAKRKKSRKIWIYGLVPMLALIISQIAIIFWGVSAGGLTKRLDDSALQSLRATTQARMEFTQSSMMKRWTEMTASVQEINEIYNETIVQQGYTITDVLADNVLYSQFLIDATKSTVELLRRNATSSVFIILADEESVSSEENTFLPGIYLQDRDPTSSYQQNNFDLLFERGPVSVVQAAGIATDSYWAPLFSVHDDLADFFSQPYNQAIKNHAQDMDALGYWSGMHRLKDNPKDTYMYTVPLVASNGEVYGILGIGISADYMSRYIPTSELFSGEGTYALIRKNGEQEAILVDSFSAHYRYNQPFWNEFLKQVDLDNGVNLYRYDKENYTAYSIAFTFYDQNSPFSSEKWYLCSVVPDKALYSVTNQSTLIVILLFVCLTFFGILSSITIIYKTAVPISRMQRQLLDCDIAKSKLTIERTGIVELDMLGNAIEQLNDNVRNSAGKFSQLLEMSSIGLGACEYNKINKAWFISHNFFQAFKEDVQVDWMDIGNVKGKLSQYEPYIIKKTDTNSSKEFIYEFPNEYTANTFVRLVEAENEEIIRIFVEDVTAEYNELRILEYERNHDGLTAMKNHRCFYENYFQLIEKGEEVLQYAAVVMLDLDNLKIVNDLHGHSAGDRYICAVAQVLLDIESEQIMVSRISGDEFLVFLYGYQTQEAVLENIAQIQRVLSLQSISLPDASVQKICISAGIACYPQDSTDANELVRYADFAMYQGKRATKGCFTRFEKSTYLSAEQRIREKEALNEMIQKQDIQYHFQPIIDAKTGQVYAYEALMRPSNRVLNNPLNMLRIAKIQNRLSEIEELTMFLATKSFVNWCENEPIASKTCRLFINSIASQCLSLEKQEIYEQQFADYLSRLVIEYTEEEHASEENIRCKGEMVERWNAAIALDDYGSGYNGENMLLETRPKYIKMDIGLIQNIHCDINRQQRVRDLINYAHERKILVIAEGVENALECQALQALAVDFMQGYYFAKPNLLPPCPNPESLQKLLEYV